MKNSLEFTSFKLHADSTLKSMTKDELIRYIHTLHHNWSVADEQMCNLIEYNKKFDECRPYKFEDLKFGMWVWDDLTKTIVRVFTTFVDKGKKITRIKHDECYYNIPFKENRFFPVHKADMKEVSK